MNAHTKGPWERSPLGYIVPAHGDPLQRRVIASIYDDPMMPSEANARLIAAAPDLLAALKWVLQEIEWGHDMTASAAIIDQIIAKTEGKS